MLSDIQVDRCGGLIFLGPARRPPSHMTLTGNKTPGGGGGMKSHPPKQLNQNQPMYRAEKKNQCISSGKGEEHSG